MDKKLVNQTEKGTLNLILMYQNLSVEEQNNIIHNRMLNVVEEAYNNNRLISCQEVIDMTSDLAKKMKVNLYGNFGPLKKVLWRKATTAQQIALRNSVTDKYGKRLFFDDKKWIIN